MADFAPRRPRRVRKCFIAALQGPSTKGGGIQTLPCQLQKPPLRPPFRCARPCRRASCPCGRHPERVEWPVIDPHCGRAPGKPFLPTLHAGSRTDAGGRRRCGGASVVTAARLSCYIPPQTTFSSHNHRAAADWQVLLSVLRVVHALAVCLELGQMVLAGRGLPVSDPQLLIQRHPRLSATAGVVVGALQRCARPIPYPC